MRHGGSVEEIADPKLDGDILNEVVIPLMANNRIAANGKIDLEDEVHKFENYVTTAGTKQSFAFSKMEEILYEMILDKKSIMIGNSYELPVYMGHLDADFVNEKRESTTYNPLSFAREYESIWTGTSDKSFVDLEDLNECRVLSNEEIKADIKDKKSKYILAYDVARSEKARTASSSLVVIKITPRKDGTYSKHVVNVYGFEGSHFNEQASFLKRKVNEYNASMLIVDANGLGVGLVDVLVTEHDENPPYSVVNDDDYNKYKKPNSIPMLYAIKSTNKATKDSDINNYFMSIVSNKGVKLLKTESQARLEIKPSKKKSSEQINKELQPYIMTDLLCEEIMNLEYHQSGNNTQVKQISRGINKDKFSALAYGLYYVNLLERKNKQKRREKIDVSKYMMIKNPKTRKL